MRHFERGECNSHQVRQAQGHAQPANIWTSPMLLGNAELQDLPVHQFDGVASELAHAELRPLQISQTLHLALSLNWANTASLPSQLLRRLPDQRVDPLEVATPAMGAVQTEDVGARLRSRLSRSPRLTWIILGIISSLQDAGPKLATTSGFHVSDMTLTHLGLSLAVVHLLPFQRHSAVQRPWGPQRQAAVHRLSQLPVNTFPSNRKRTTRLKMKNRL